MPTNPSFAFLGGGVMATAILRSLLDAGLVAGERVSISEPQEARRQVLAELGVRAVASNTEAVAGADVVVLAVKPYVIPAVLQEIVDSDATFLLVARDLDGRIVGSLTLVLFRIPTGLRAWIEDVVVDDAAKGQGVGEALNRYAIDVAAERGARSVDLTSRPSREAANRLYRRLGFEPRETNVYRYQG